MVFIGDSERVYPILTLTEVLANSSADPAASEQIELEINFKLNYKININNQFVGHWSLTEVTSKITKNCPKMANFL